MSLLLSLQLFVLAVFGAMVGRFLNICVERFPEHDLLSDQLRSLRQTWTVCRRCSTVPVGLERIPVVGWLFSRRCHACKSRLSVELPLLEFLTAVLFAGLYWAELPAGFATSVAGRGLTSVEGPAGPEVITSLLSPIVWLHLRFLLHAVMLCGLIVATAIDRKLRIIPDGCTVPIMLFAVVCSFMSGQLYIVPIWFQDPSTVRILQPMMPALLKPLFVPWDPTSFVQSYPHLHGLLVSLTGCIAGAGSVWLVRQIGFLVLRQEAMGFGDVVLMGMIGSVIGWQPVLAVFMFAPTLAIFAAVANWFAHRDNEIPYGPCLSGATVLLLLTWPYSWPFAKRFFDMGPFLVLLAALMTVLLATSLQLVQIVKRLFGFGEANEAEAAGWNSADHLSYYNSERPDEQTGQWSRDQWDGCRSGRGLLREHNWRRRS